MNPEFANPEAADNASLTLSELENEVIAFFVDTVRWFGAPKSLGAIYGLLFITAEPISFEQIATRLQMSNGSVSQGLKIVKDLGAVKVTFKPGERGDFFVAETQLRQLVSGFLRQRVKLQPANGEGRLAPLFDGANFHGVSRSANSVRIQERMHLLRRRQTQARSTLPLVLKMFEG